MTRLMLVVSKSFLPILLVFAALYAGLFAVHLSALSDAEKVTVIQVGALGLSEWAANNLDSGQELDAYHDPAYLKGIERLSQDNFDEVEQQVAVLATTGNTKLSRLLAARLAYAQHKYAISKTLFDELLAMPEPPLSGYFYRAMTLEKLKQLPAALDDYAQVLAVNPNHYAARYNRADVALALGKTAQAIADLKQAESIVGGERRSKALIKLADAYHLAKQESQVKTTLDAAIRYAPTSVAARMALAEWYEQNGQHDAAIREYDLTRDITPSVPSVHVELAKAYLRHHRLQSAEQAYRNALQLSPNYLPGQFGLIDFLIDQARATEAVDMLKALLLKDPLNARAYFKLGRISYRLNTMMNPWLIIKKY